MEPSAPPDLRDVEQKLGRKVPESLAGPLRGEELLGRPVPAPARGPAAALGPRRRRAAALTRLETKLHLLRQEMVSRRAPTEGPFGSCWGVCSTPPHHRVLPGGTGSARGALPARWDEGGFPPAPRPSPAVGKWCCPLPGAVAASHPSGPTTPRLPGWQQRGRSRCCCSGEEAVVQLNAVGDV